MPEKRFYSCLDSKCIGEVPQALQHILIGEFAKALGGRTVFYTIEDPYTVQTQEVVQGKLADQPEIDGMIFYQLAQFFYGARPRFGLMAGILKQGYSLHFARERISVTNEIELETVSRLASIVSSGKKMSAAHYEAALQEFSSKSTRLGS